MVDRSDPGDTGSPATKRRALIALALTLVTGVVAWNALSRAANYGVERVSRIEAARVPCDTGWAHALSYDDTLAVDRKPLRDTIDPGTNAVLDRCGTLRATRTGPP